MYLHGMGLKKRISRKLSVIKNKVLRMESECSDVLQRIDTKLDTIIDSKVETRFIDLPTSLDGPWSNEGNKRFRAGATVATVLLPAGKVRSRDGVNNKYKLKGFPAKQAELKFQVYVDKDWQAVKGGKLPGLFIGKGTGGKNYKKNDGSFRIMWRRGGRLVGYLYPCMDQGKDIRKRQGKEFTHACDDEFPAAGIDLWRQTKDCKMTLVPGQWNDVTIGMRLNDKGVSNGALWLEVNGDKGMVTDAYLTDNPDKNTINGVQWSMWYGGSNTSWAPSKDQVFKFKNIQYRTK